MRPYALALLAITLPLAACDNGDPTDDPTPLEATTVSDLAADPTTGRDSTTGAPLATGRFAFYSLRENRLVLGSDEADRADSTSAEWDIAFRGTTIIANGGDRGPEQGGLLLVDSLFEEVSVAPATGYTYETSAALPDSLRWYNYNPQANVITPKPGRVLVVRTADGRYAKVRILSYYEGGTTAPTASDTPRYYTFEYVFQPDGSRGFETTTGED